MQKNLIAMLKSAKDEGRLEGMIMGCDIAAIALNHTYGFGDARLSVVGAECQKIFDEIQKAEDLDRVLCDMYKELSRIRPNSEEFFLKRYIKK